MRNLGVLIDGTLSQLLISIQSLNNLDNLYLRKIRHIKNIVRTTSLSIFSTLSYYLEYTNVVLYSTGSISIIMYYIATLFTVIVSFCLFVFNTSEGNRFLPYLVYTKPSYPILYKKTSKFYFKTYFNGPDEGRNRDLLLVWLTH